MKAYKGFDKDMKCREYQFEEGKEYVEDEAVLCEKGFHACEHPLNCFDYYAPAESVYHEVELDDVADGRRDDTKVCGKRIKIGARLTIGKLVDAAISYVFERSHPEEGGHATGDQGAASATGTRGAAVALGIGGKAKAAKGGFVTVAEWAQIDGNWQRIDVQSIKVDGDAIKADTYYMLVGGEFVEA